MRSHADIIKAAKPETIASALDISVNTVRAWRQRNSIPADKWPALIEAGIAGLDELSPDLARLAAKSAA